MLRLGDLRVSDKKSVFDSVSVDEYVASGNALPTVIKIDVDGFELHVLNGARKCLTQVRPRLWLEAHPEFLAAQQKSAADVLGLLQEMGYTLNFFMTTIYLVQRSLTTFGANKFIVVWC